MKRYFLTAAAFLTVAGASLAQEPFKDVPRDHWAYDAVQTLSQRGLIIGYPDGTFGGKRAMTRYELAQVVARMIPQLERYIQEQAAANKGATPDLSNYVTKDQLSALQRLVDEFGPELRLLRVDVDQAKRDINDLRGRVAVLETEVGRVKFSGEMNTVARMSSLNRSTMERGASPLDLDGRRLNPTTNLLEATQVLYDMDLDIVARVSREITANALLSIGNYVGGYSTGTMLPTMQSYQNPFPYGKASIGGLNAEITPWKAYIEAPISLRPLGIIDVEAGKTGVQFTPYTLKMIDHDSYTNITKTDNGDVIFTGVKGKARVGGVGLTAYAGTHQKDMTSSGFPVFLTAGFTPRPQNPLYSVSGAIFPTVPTANVNIEQSAGVHATVGTPFGGTLGLTYIQGATQPYPFFGTTQRANGAIVWGADLALNLTKGVGLTAEFSSSDLVAGNKLANHNTVYPRHLNNAYDARLAFGLGGLALTAGYNRVDPFFGAPGYWGTMGSWKNPTNVKGFVGSASYAFTPKLSLAGTINDYRSVIRGYGAIANVPGGSLENNDSTKIQHYTVGLRYGLTSTNRVDLGMESVNYGGSNPNVKGLNGKDARENYYNIGFGHDVSANTSIKLLYQIIEYKNHFLTGGQDARGNVATAQFQVKY